MATYPLGASFTISKASRRAHKNSCIFFTIKLSFISEFFYFYNWRIVMFFDGGINKELVKSMLGTLPRRDQTQILQDLYNKGYSVPDIAKATDIAAPTI